MNSRVAVGVWTPPTSAILWRAWISQYSERWKGPWYMNFWTATIPRRKAVPSTFSFWNKILGGSNRSQVANQNVEDTCVTSPPQENTNREIWWLKVWLNRAKIDREYTKKSFLGIWHYFSVFFYFSGAGNEIVINRIKQTARKLRARVNKEGTQGSSLKNIPLSWQ